MRRGIMLLLVVMCMFSMTTLSQTGTVVNFSFETADAINPRFAANWAPQWNGYLRVQMLSNSWDGNYALMLSQTANPTNLAGAVQRITLNQIAPAPVLVTIRVRGQNIQDLSTDKYGASLYCRVRYQNGSMDYSPTTLKTKMVGTFDWIILGINTATLNNGDQPISWIEVVPILGAVSGTAWFDDVHVTQYSPGSFAGAVTLMFDDGFIEHYSVAYPALRTYGYVATEAAVVNYITTYDPAYMNLDNLKEMANNGWEVASHSVTHSDMTTETPTAMEDEFYFSKKFFQDNAFNVRSFVLPYGAYNGLVLATNKQSYYFSSVRGVERGYNPMGAFPFDIKIQEVDQTTTLNDIETWLTTAHTRKAWLVILCHKIRPSCDDLYCTSITTFNSMLTAVHASGLPVVTYAQGLDLVKSPR